MNATTKKLGAAQAKLAKLLGERRELREKLDALELELVRVGRQCRHTRNELAEQRGTDEIVRGIPALTDVLYAPAPADGIESFEAALERFVLNVDFMYTKATRHSNARNGWRGVSSKLRCDKAGRRYVRVWTVGDDARESVFAFVERATGYVYKPATYKAAAKHPRGTVYRGADEYGLDRSPSLHVRLLA